MFIWIAKKNSKFHAKRLNWSENMLKSFRRGATVLGGGLLFWEGGYCFRGLLFFKTPRNLCDPSHTAAVFGRSLKSFLFSEYQCTQCIRGICDDALYRLMFYLLTYLLTYYKLRWLGCKPAVEPIENVANLSTINSTILSLDAQTKMSRIDDKVTDPSTRAKRRSMIRESGLASSCLMCPTWMPLTLSTFTALVS